MKQICFILVCLFCCCGVTKALSTDLWQPAGSANLPKNIQLMHPNHYLVYSLDVAGLKSIFFNISSNPSDATIVTLPLPDGTFRDFRIWQKSMMPGVLAAKYPDIKTFTGEAINNSTITLKLDFTVYGFHAMIFDGEKTSFIDPYDLFNDGYYMVHYLSDETLPLNQRTHCLVNSGNLPPIDESVINIEKSTRKNTQRVTNGYKLRTYRLALCADSKYCQAATGLTSPTIAQCLSAMTTAMNRVNGVYERELSVSMNFVPKEDTLIWPTQSGSINGSDPFFAIDADASSCTSENQYVCDARIVDSNYDIGHVFTTGAGGLSDVGITCTPYTKAHSVTGQPYPVGDGFTINYVAHEIGHEFGANHPFNDNMDGSCNGNAVEQRAYEPGSGTTIMAYAGICSPDDPQQNSDAYFHAISLMEMNAYITTDGDACAAKMSTLNLPVGLYSFTRSYSIPYLTPFELTAPIATDSVSADTLTTYCWEEWNLGDFGLTFANTHLSGPIFRSFNPVAYPSTRVFPRIEHVITGHLNDAGNENDQGEKVPDSARYLTFKLTMRDIYSGNGCFLIPDDTIHLDVINTSTDVINTGAGFTVSSQATPGIIYEGGSAQTITWNVVNTVVEPINATRVEIYMSVDGGYNWMYHIGTFENTGSATVVVPNPPATTNRARFKVKGSNNVFFNINSNNFTVNYNPSDTIWASVTSVPGIEKSLNLYPIPAHGLLHISSSYNTPVRSTIYNVTGQAIWKGTIAGQCDLEIATWAKGIYYMIAVNAQNERIVKRFTIE